MERMSGSVCVNCRCVIVPFKPGSHMITTITYIDNIITILIVIFIFIITNIIVKATPKIKARVPVTSYDSILSNNIIVYRQNSRAIITA